MSANATVDLSISGMSCGNCVHHVTEALREVSGVSNATVSLADGRATVAYDPQVATEERMIEAVEEAGYRATVAAGGRAG